MKETKMLGVKFGRLTPILKIRHGPAKIIMWVCQCECGNLSVARTQCLKRGESKSCGCLARMLARDFMIGRNTTHGKSRSTTYNSWASMKKRCLNKNTPNYRDYGGRGITVCERWMKFENFLADMGEKPSSIHTLERKNNNSSYCKENCCWATMLQQQNNKRSNVRMSIDGVTRTLSEWCMESGINYATFYGRVFGRGWDAKRAITQPVQTRTKGTR